MRNRAQIMGDNLHDTFMETGDLESARVALRAYNTALRSAKDELIYNKHYHPDKLISFYESK